MNNGTNQESASSASIAVLTIDVSTSFAMYLAKHLTPDQLKYWQSHKKEGHLILRKAFQIPDDPYLDMRLDWQAFHKKRYGWDVDFSQVFIPLRPSLAHRLIIVAKGLMADMVYRARSFKKWKNPSYGESFSVSVPTNIRTSAHGHYVIWVLDGVEPDVEFLGKSTSDADPEMKIGMTFTERLLLEDKYFDETGKHLDLVGGTFCGGSRDADGCVPFVRLVGDGLVGVGWRGLGSADPRYGVRRAGSGPLST